MKQNLRPHINGLHIIGLDMGYSGPKCYHEKGNFVFPNYCKRITGELFGELNRTDMVYENLNTHDKYAVGMMALKSLNDDDVVSEDALYGRNHYLHPDFKVTFETSLGIALWTTETDGHDVFLQTGLPPAYMVKDEPYLRSVVEGEHHFRLTIGSETKDFHITLDKSRVDIMSQPMGTLTSLLFDDNARPTAHAVSLMKSNLMVFDCGFGTLDTFFIRANQLESKNTNPNLGMKRILTETRDLIEQDLNVSMSIPAMQKVLKDRAVKVNDLMTLQTKEYPINDYLDQANKKVCNEALESIKDYIFNIKYLIMTGGTSEAWIDEFRKRLATTNVEVLSGKTGSNLPTIYANARGYYYSRLRILNSKRKEKCE
jgi:plasmid segregation protein ParM